MDKPATYTSGSLTKKDLEELIEDLQKSSQRPYQMIVGKGWIQVVFDRYGKEGLRAYLSDPNYEFMMGSEAYELALKLME